jgi:hypothetical protein
MAASVAVAQPSKDAKDTATSSRPETAPVAPSSGGIREAKPETMYVRDKDGRLVPFVMSYEELHRLLLQDLKLNQPGPALPPYSLQDVTIQGTADQRQADFTIGISVRVQSEGWIRVPLRFNDAVLRESPKHQGEGEFFLEYEKEGGGYVWFLKGPADKLQTLTLHMTVPIREVGNESRLSLQMPRATSSQFTLTVPFSDVIASASGGVLQVRKQEQQTQFLVAGLNGDFQLAWRRGDTKPAQVGPLLDVRSETLVTIEGQRQVSADIKLKVSSQRVEFSVFSLRLPAGMRLRPRQFGQTGFQVAETAAADGATARTVQVKLDRPMIGPVEVLLAVDLAPVADAKGSEYDLSGLEVNDAVRQTGTIDFAVKGDWLVTWKPGANVQRTAVPDTLKQKVAARFEFARRSYSMRLLVAEKETAISVEPTYLLHVDAHRVRLEARLKYKIRGTDVFGVEVRLPGWRVTDVTPADLIEDDTLDLEKVDPLELPLAPAALSGADEFQLQLTAEQELADISQTVSLTLPRPVGKTIAPATMVVLPADNVELNVVEGELQGLERDTAPPPSVELPSGHPAPQYFRERSDAKTTVFAAQLRIRPRVVSVDLKTNLRLDATRVRVEQQFQYHITYEPLRTVQLQVPSGLLEDTRLRIRCGQQPLPYLEVPEAGPAAPAAAEHAVAKTEPGTKRVQVDLLDARIGPYELVLQYDVDTPELPAAEEAAVRVPLVLPLTETHWVISANVLRLQLGDNLQARVEGETWNVADESESRPEGTANELSYETSELPEAVTLQLRRKEARSQGSILVRQVWVQSWLAGGQRRDRAVFRLTTPRNRVTILPPPGALLEEVALDGYQVAGFAPVGGVAVLDLPPGLPLREHVIELWYVLPGDLPTVGQLYLDAPRIEDAKWTNKWYWQVAVPPDLHLLATPASLTAEMTWQRPLLLWERRAALRQPDLERLLGATEQDPLPASLNQYLFSSFGELPRLRLTMMTRWVLLLLASGCVLLAGLLLMYTGVLRHPLVLVGAGVGLLILVAWSPDLAALAGQAAGLGLLLLVMAQGLKWLVGWRQAGRTVVRGVSAPLGDSKTLRSASLPAEGSSFATTSTAPVVLHLPATESKP